MKILFYGDSITDASRNRSVEMGLAPLGLGYVRDIAASLAKENPVKYEVINRGVSGNRIVDLYARVKGDFWNLKPDLVSILIGVNDVWHEINHQTGVEIDRFEKMYRMLIEDTQKVLPDLKFVLCEPFVLEGAATQENYDKFLYVKEYARVVEKLAKEYGLYYLPLQAKFDEMAAVYGAAAYSRDGVHPDVAGAKLIADEWMTLFKEEIDK